MKSTSQHRKFWKNRKINWEQDYLLADGAMNHPHRDMILDVLSTLTWQSIIEVGMGAGANLKRIQDKWPSCQVGGIDINKEAVETAAKHLNPKSTRYLDVGEPTDIFLSDNSIDVAMSDACLIYFGPKEVRKAIKEMKRVARNYLVFCEFHHPSLSKRFQLRYKTGYFAYDYQSLLEEMDCYNIQIRKIPKEVWGGDPWETFGNIITCEFV